MHSEKLKNTRYDDLGKPMKQTSFKVKKNLGETIPREQLRFTVQEYKLVVNLTTVIKP